MSVTFQNHMLYIFTTSFCYSRNRTWQLKSYQTFKIISWLVWFWMLLESTSGNEKQQLYFSSWVWLSSWDYCKLLRFLMLEKINHWSVVSSWRITFHSKKFLLLGQCCRECLHVLWCTAAATTQTSGAKTPANIKWRSVLQLRACKAHEGALNWY